MELLSIETAVSHIEQERFGSDPSFVDHLRSQSARALAEKTIRDCAIYRRIDPSEEELRQNPLAPVRHRWRIGIERSMPDLEAREKQMDEARRGGLLEAAEFLLGQVALYARADGRCKHVLVHQLESLAAALQKQATE